MKIIQWGPLKFDADSNIYLYDDDNKIDVYNSNGAFLYKMYMNACKFETYFYSYFSNKNKFVFNLDYSRNSIQFIEYNEY